MIELEENKEKTIRYLFGELDEAERDALEDRLFEDDDLGLYLAAVEKDLIDEYIRGELDAGLRNRFDQSYLVSDARREKIRAAKILHERVFAELAVAEETPAPVRVPAENEKTSFWQALNEFFRAPKFALAGGLAMILLFLLFAGWILLRRAPNAPEIVQEENTNRTAPVPTPETKFENPPVRDNSNVQNPDVQNSNVPNSDVPNSDVPNSNAAASPKPPASENKTSPRPPAPRPSEKRPETAPPPSRPFFATLLPLLRSDRTPTLAVPKNAADIRLRVVHDNLRSYARYRAEIRGRSGAVIYTREFPVSEKTISRPLVLNLKAAALKPGAYELTLSGVDADNRAEEIKFYNFSVTKN